MYNNKKVGTYRPDFIVNDQVIIELKSLPFIGAIEKKQLWNYLKGTEYKIALLANFGKERLSIDRVVYDTARFPRLSASGQQLFAYTPHFLSMSATPIPRTLMLTIFGDLDISLISELPAGRRPIITKIVAPENRNKAYAFIGAQVKTGRQVFVICPRIDPTQTGAGLTQKSAERFPRLSTSSLQLSALEAKSVKEEYEKLSKRIFPDLKVAMLHGRLKSKEKNEVMKKFGAGETDILVSTSVIEVGIDVPNATIMMVEGSERFGLAQIYQFRGRVGRGAHQSYCFLFTESNSKTVSSRLNSIMEAKNGLELAEKDLKLRGPGEFLGQAQTGLPDYAMRGLQDLELVKSSREAAVAIITKDRILKKYPDLRGRLEKFQRQIHSE